MYSNKQIQTFRRGMTLPFGVSPDVSQYQDSTAFKMFMNPYLYGEEPAKCFANFVDLFLDYQYILMGVFEQDASMLTHLKQDIPHRQQGVKEDCGIAGPAMHYFLESIIHDLNKYFAYIILFKIAYDEAYNGLVIHY